MSRTDLQRLSRKELISLLESFRDGQYTGVTLWHVECSGKITRQRNGKIVTVTPETLVSQFNRATDHLLCLQDAQNPYIDEPGPVIHCTKETALELQHLFFDKAHVINFYE